MSTSEEKKPDAHPVGKTIEPLDKALRDILANGAAGYLAFVQVPLASGVVVKAARRWAPKTVEGPELDQR